MGKWFEMNLFGRFGSKAFRRREIGWSDERHDAFDEFRRSQPSLMGRWLRTTHRLRRKK